MIDTEKITEVLRLEALLSQLQFQHMCSKHADNRYYGGGFEAMETRIREVRAELAAARG